MVIEYALRQFKLAEDSRVKREENRMAAKKAKKKKR